MISSFTNFTQLTTLSTPLPITPAEVRAKSQYFENNRNDTSLDAEINAEILQGVLNWEGETKFLLFDQTFKVFIYNQYTFNPDFCADLPVLNVYSFDSIKYYPCDWNFTDSKTTLASNLYYFTEQCGVRSAIFRMPNTNLQIYKEYSNLELNAKGGYENNDFTNMPLEIKNALIMMTADAFDGKKGMCGARYTSEVNRIYGKYKLFNLTITI